MVQESWDYQSQKSFEGTKKFDGTNFGYWKMHDKYFLTYMKMHKAGNERPKRMSDKELDNLNEETIAIIRMCLPMNVATLVASETSAVKLMEVLTNRYGKPSANSKTYLLKKYFNMQMAKDVSINSYINGVTTLINQLKSVKIEFTDEVYAIQLLMSLPDSWETMKAIMSNSIGDNTLKFLGMCDLAIAKQFVRRTIVKNLL